MSSSTVRTLLCIIGIAVSLYAYDVETKAEHAKETGEEYEAMCDLSPKVSCTAVFTSEYGKGFRLIQKVVGDDHWLVQPNSVYGLLFYAAMLVIGLVGGTEDLTFLMSIVSCCGSAYLAYILVYVLEDTCIVCISMYIINGSLLITNYLALPAKASSADKKAN